MNKEYLNLKNQIKEMLNVDHSIVNNKIAAILLILSDKITKLEEEFKQIKEENK